MNVFRWTKRPQLVALVCAVWILVPFASADALDYGEQCDSCHGADGVSTEGDIPTIAGTSAFMIEEYMFQYLEDARPCRESKYRFGDTDRPATDMCAIAKELSEDEFAEAAEHFSNKEFVAAKQEFDAAKAEVGKMVHKKDCEKCHSDGGSYADDDAGILAGQWMPYLEQVFADYESGERGMMEDKMKDKMDALDAASIDALVHYYASMQ